MRALRVPHRPLASGPLVCPRFGAVSWQPGDDGLVASSKQWLRTVETGPTRKRSAH